MIDWTHFTASTPGFLGVDVFDASDNEKVRTYFDWNTFLQRWEVAVPYPDVLDLPDQAGKPVWELLANANTLINELIAQNSLQAQVTFGVWKAGSSGNRVLIYPKNGTEQTLVFERHQPDLPDSQPYCLADFIKPASLLASGESDYMGGYWITLPTAVRTLLEQFQTDNDEYRAFLLDDVCALYRSAVADYLHYRLRRFIWAYCDDDDLSNDEIAEGLYQGIRVEIGGGECPDVALMTPLRQLLHLDTNPADPTFDPMLNVGGFFFGHPKSRNFTIETSAPTAF